jgi:phage tail-like protein
MRSEREPFGNMRFRLEIEGMQSTGAVEVVFPEARIVGGRGKARVTQYGTLTLKRGVTGSHEWYEWWDRARTSKTGSKRKVTVTLLDERGSDANQWTFLDARPFGYLVSNLNALGNEPLIETLELTVGGFKASFGT